MHQQMNDATFASNNARLRAALEGLLEGAGRGVCGPCSVAGDRERFMEH